MEGLVNRWIRGALVVALIAVGLPLAAESPKQKPESSKQKSTASEKQAKEKRPAAKSSAVDEANEEKNKDSIQKQTESPIAPGDSPLVRAAKAAQESREKDPPKLHLTDKDAADAKGTLIEVSQKPLKKMSSEQKQKEERAKETRRLQNAEVEKKKTEYSKVIKDTEAKIKNLQDELDGLEEKYLDEQDPGARDLLQQRFVTAKKELAKQKEYLQRMKAEHDRLGEN